MRTRVNIALSTRSRTTILVRDLTILTITTEDRWLRQVISLPAVLKIIRASTTIIGPDDSIALGVVVADSDTFGERIDQFAGVSFPEIHGAVLGDVDTCTTVYGVG